METRVKTQPLLGVIFSSIAPNKEKGWPIGRSGSIPWYSSKERVHFSKLCSPPCTLLVGARTHHRFASLPNEFKIISRSKRSHYVWPVYTNIFDALDEVDSDVAMVVGGRRVFKAALNQADFVIILQHRIDVFANEFIKLPPPSSNWMEVSRRLFDDFVELRVVNPTNFSHGLRLSNGHFLRTVDDLTEAVMGIGRT